MPIKRIATITTLIATSLLVVGQSQATQNPPKAFKQCVACHGIKGQGNAAVKSPAIAGQSKVYVTRQLEHFARGIRGSHSKDILGMQMNAFAKNLSESDIKEIADYISKLEPVFINNNLNGDMKNGSRYYQAKCGACHGGKAEGNPSFNAPRLAGQNNDYLLRQMKNFTAGIRGADAKDTFGKQMAMMAKTVNEQELADILFYISKQQ